MNNPKFEIQNPKSETPQSFDRQIEAASRRLTTLKQSGESSAVLAEALEELAIALEELQVAGEELHHQNEELAATRQAVEAERRRYQELFEFAPDGYLVTNAEGVIQEANRAVATLLNRDQHFQRGKPLVLFVAEENRQTFHTHLTRLQAGDVTRVEDWELEIQPQGHPPFPATLTVAAIRDAEGQITGLRWLLRDITKRVQAETALRRAHEELEQRIAEQTADLLQERNFVSAILDTVKALVVVCDTQGNIVRFNRTCELITGYTFDEVKGKAFWDLLLPSEEIEAVKAVFNQLRSGQFPNEFENHWITKDGSRRLIAWSNTALLDHQGSVEYIVGTGIDITERKQAEKALRESGARLEGIISTATDAIITVDARQRIILFNNAAGRMFGYTADEVIGQPLDLLIPARFREVHTQHVHRFGLTGVTATTMGSIPDELWGRRAGGDEFPIEAFISQVVISGKRLYTVILRDITERKQIEEENAQLFEAVSQQSERLRALTARLAEAEETERKRLARELHDQVGQNLTALGLNLNIIRAQIPEACPQVDLIYDRLDECLAMVEQVTERLRDVMANLRPPVLDDYGVVAALRWYGARFAEWVGLTVTVHGEEPDPRLAAPVENALFRIAQEALTNAAKHAQATQVLVTVAAGDETVRLVIADDGVGFEPAGPAELAGRQSWGLLSMTERAEAVGGHCRIESCAGQGTRVIVEIMG